MARSCGAGATIRHVWTDVDLSFSNHTAQDMAAPAACERMGKGRALAPVHHTSSSSPSSWESFAAKDDLSASLKSWLRHIDQWRGDQAVNL